MLTPHCLRRVCSSCLPLALAAAILSIAPLTRSSRQDASLSAGTTHSVSAGIAELDIKLINNNDGDLLFACRLFTDGQTLTLIGTGPNDAFLFRRWNGRRFDKALPFAAHRIVLADPELAKAFAAIIANFELCMDREVKIVDGGWITKIECRKNRHGPTLHASCISPDLAYREVRKLDSLCRELGVLFQHELRGDTAAKAKITRTLRADAQELATRLLNRREAHAELEIAYANDATCPWEKITTLTRFRPEMGELANQAPLVKEAHGILSAVFSPTGVRNLFGPDDPIPSACLIRIGEVVCRFGSFNGPSQEPDWGFGDIQNSLGFMYTPVGSPLRVAMLDVGTERLLLDFVFQEPAAYFGKTLSLDHGTWTVRTQYYGNRIELTPLQQERLDYAMWRSGLLEFLFNGSFEDLAYVDILTLSQRDNQSRIADGKIDFSIGASRWVLPFSGKRDLSTWTTHTRWFACAYYSPDHVCYHRDAFRTPDEVRAMDRGEFKTVPAK